MPRIVSMPRYTTNAPPSSGNFAGFQRFDEALKGLASESRCLSKLALKLAHIACEKQAQHHGTPDITWIAPGCTQQSIERRRAFLERIRCQKVRVPKVSIARDERQGVCRTVAAY